MEVRAYRFSTSWALQGVAGYCGRAENRGHGEGRAGEFPCRQVLGLVWWLETLGDDPMVLKLYCRRERERDGREREGEEEGEGGEQCSLWGLISSPINLRFYPHIV